ncbi:MAG: M43 family zinc metalloprotease [Bacteroidota bacterium]|nr:M43 family zinc metalloprotease [Bacteroidota bacterium]
MIKNYFLKIFTIGAITLQSVNLNAQEYKCAADAIHNQEMANNTAYRQKMDDFENYLAANKGKLASVQGGVIYRIPVVVHVMHKGEALGSGTNVSDEAVKNGIKWLNERYRKIPGTPGDANGVDVEIEFALAVRDQNGNCTDGITRTDMSSDATYMQYGVKRSGANGITDAALKAIISWNQTQYYNIWLISEIDDNNGGSGTQGYAYYASSHGTANDGAVMLAGKFILQDRVTLAHELGHALNLYHTFEGDVNGTTCPTGNQCGSGLGDCCGDTPPHIRTTISTCAVGTNACDGGSSTDLHLPNYLDYSADVCQNMFTADQKIRMLAALTTTRASFLGSNGNMSLVPPTIAGIDFTASSQFLCAGSSVSFTDFSACTPNTYINTPWSGISFNWTFANNSGTTYNSTEQNPTITFVNAGTYDVTLSITNGQGNSSYTRQGMLIVSTAPIAPSCTGATTYAATLTYGIYEVHLNTLDHYSSGTYGDIQSGATNVSGYGDFVCSAGTILEANTTYTISVKGTSSASLIEDFRAYIDYNNDGDFVDAGEQVAAWDSIPGSTSLLNATFTTPASPIMNTSLRMRVFSGRNTETITPCFTTARGQVHDYSVWVTDRVARVSIAPSPAGTITAGTNVTFTASPANEGTAPTYKWFKNNVVIGGATSVTYSSTALADNDEIYCVMTSNLANIIASPCTSNVVIMDVTGAIGITTSNSQTNSFTVFPNPNKGEFSVKFTSTEKSTYSLEVTNVLGEIIHKENFQEQNGQYSKQMDIGKYGAGLYFITLKNGKHTICKKVVVQ